MFPKAVSYEDIKTAEATIKASSSPSPLASTLSTLNTNTLPPPPLPQQPPPSLPSPTISHIALTATPIVAPEPSPIQQQVVTNNNDSTQQTINQLDKDSIIAKDIETEKLLTAIEQSKGFSDSFSTTRRARNRCIPFSSNSINSERVRNRFH